MPNTFSMAEQSFGKFMGLFWRNELRLNHKRIGATYTIKNGTYAIFRETERPKATGEAVILVIGFRLKLIRSSRLFHWIFQRTCILTTPFWSGLAGFKTKLWMVDADTKNYLGIYDWRGKKDADRYINFLLPILKFFSLRGSVWAWQIYDQDFERYLNECATLASRAQIA